MQKPGLKPVKISLRADKIKMRPKIAVYDKVKVMRTGVKFEPEPEETTDDRLPEYER